jgi:hypothetical protein
VKLPNKTSASLRLCGRQKVISRRDAETQRNWRTSGRRKTEESKKPKPNRSRLWRFLPVALILIGLAVTVLFGLRSVRSFRQVQYIQQQGLDRGAASVEAIQPWMTIRFIAVAYAVPEEYLYSALDVAFDRRNGDRPIGRIQPMPTPLTDGSLPTPIPDFGTVIVEKAKAAVLAYQADPVATGLQDIRSWMSLRYISNSGGIPLDELFTKTQLSPTLNPDKPLDLLAAEEKYPGGPRGLVDDVAKALGVAAGGGRP